ncbi:MAG: hypothetical protein JRH18_03625 [Deltaproteobacteria bacterium]|nr:hypothetical protein [Deltaproteobacteria bacterium]MBW1960870.1 hypothetical protein [Deltaproteobacteria bacterium]MBW2150738.1 hypothetical protein [Deltaproteobacteria bacterium]
MSVWLQKSIGAKTEAMVTIAGAGFIALMGLSGIFILPDDHTLGKISAATLLFAAGCFFCKGVRILRAVSN